MLYCFYRVSTKAQSQPRMPASGKRGSKGKRILRWAIAFLAVAVIVDAAAKIVAAEPDHRNAEPGFAEISLLH